MRPFLLKLVSVAIIMALNVSIFAEKSVDESRLIRRLFLDVAKVPPSPAELNWYVCYNHQPYISAVEWITNKYNKDLKQYLLSDEYKSSLPAKLDDSMLIFIIKYQSGSINLSTKEAELNLIKQAIACGENNITDTIDYLSSCLMARSTNVQEINKLLSIFKSQPTEEKGYLAVLTELETYDDFKCK